MRTIGVWVSHLMSLDKRFHGRTEWCIIPAQTGDVIADHPSGPRTPMDALDLDRGPKLSREGRTGTIGTSSTGSHGLRPAKRPDLTRAELITLITSRVIPGRDWSRAVFHDNVRHASVEALQSAQRRIGQELPAFVYGSRVLAVELNTKAVLDVLFPDGVPPRNALSPEVHDRLQTVFQSIKDLYSCKDMEIVEIDRSVIVITEEASFCELMINTIASSGEII